MGPGRVLSIDIMRGITLILMLFVNDLFMPGVPAWFGHMEADFDGMGLADWVFPGFLFMVGMAIPFATGKRIDSGEDKITISRHIAIRTISLLIIGVLMLNTGRVEPVFTGMSRNLWSLLMYIGVFLTWNDYRDNDKNFFGNISLKLLGMALLAFLVFKFRSGEPENEGSIITGWWGILGLIGWGYMAASFVYLFARNSILYTTIAFVIFLGMNIATKLNLLTFLDPVRPILGVILEGNVPMIVLAGVLTTLIIKKHSQNHNNQLLIILSFGFLSILSGFLLRKWIIISKIQATPSWGLICIGISLILFALLYYIIDIRGKARWSNFIRPAGENSLTTYLAPDILYYIIWMSGINVLFYKQSAEPLIVIAGSIIWSLLMVGLTAVLVRIGIRLKL